MSDNTLIVGVRTAAGVGAALALIGSAIIIAQGGLEFWLSQQGTLVLLFAVVFAVFTSLAIAGQPRNRVVWMMAASSLLFGVFLIGMAGAILAGGDPGLVMDSGVVPAQLPEVSAWFVLVANVAVILALFSHVTFGLLLFPDGRVPAPGWRWLAVFAAVAIGGSTTTWAYGLRPSNTSPADSVDVFNLFFVSSLISMIACLVALGVRYRDSAGLGRQQIKLVFWGAAVFVPFVIAGGVLDGTPYDVWLPVPLVIATSVYLGSYGLAVTRYQLFDVDLVISKTAVVAGMAGFITVVYAVVVGAVGVFLGSGVDAAVPLSVAATVIVAIAFQPLRLRLTQWANRLVYGNRESPYEVLSKLSTRMRDQVATEEVMPRMAQLVGVATGAERVTVWTASLDGLTASTSWPFDGLSAESPKIESLASLNGVHHKVAIEHDGTTLGAITVTMPRDETLADGERRLVDDVAAQAGLVMRNTLLIEQLRKSRRRLVTVQDDERRKLERDLHDGAQQDFVAAKMKVAMARGLTETGEVVRAISLLDDVLSGIDEGVDSLRRLAHGIYPPLLESEGLEAALKAQRSRSGIPLDVVAVGLGRYPSEIEAAVYFCSLEAIQNANKYSGGEEIKVILRVDGNDLTFEVIDDGSGFDIEAEAGGRGLTNMADRLEALGGRLEVRSAPGRGTTVFGRLPV